MRGVSLGEGRGGKGAVQHLVPICEKRMGGQLNGVLLVSDLSQTDRHVVNAYSITVSGNVSIQVQLRFS